MPSAQATAKREALARSFLFGGLDAAELDLLAEYAVTRRVAARQELFHKGDEGSEAYAVLSGRLKASSSSPEGREITFSIMGPGDLIGELAMLHGGARTLTVTALEPSELVVLHRRDLLPMLERNPRIALAMMAALAARLGDLTETLEDTVFRELPARLARRLLVLADEYGEEDGEATRIELKLSQGELAQLVGSSRETVNKQLRSWERDGLLATRKGRLCILQRDALEDLADQFTA